MRLLFLILILLNLLYFGWQHYQLTGDVERFSASDPGLEKLVLLYEVKTSTGAELAKKKQQPISQKTVSQKAVPQERTISEEKPAPKLASKTKPEPGAQQGSRQDAQQDSQQVKAKSVDVKPVVTEENLVCYKIGPFNKKDNAQQFFEHMQPIVKQARLSEKFMTGSKFWVFLPEQKSLKAAQKIVNQLALKGINDYQILTILGKKNAISLGLYKEQKIAELRMKQIKKMGYLPEITTVKSEISRYWLEVVTDQADKALQDKINAIPRGIVKKTSCH